MIRTVAVLLTCLIAQGSSAQRTAPPSDDSSALIAEAKELQQRGDFEGALRLLNDLEASNPSKESRQALANLDKSMMAGYKAALEAAKTHFDKQQFDAADSQLVQASRYASGSPGLLFNRALIMEKLNRRSEAVALLRSLTVASPNGELLDRSRQHLSTLALGGGQSVPNIRDDSFPSLEFNKALANFETRPLRRTTLGGEPLNAVPEFCETLANAAAARAGQAFTPLMQYNKARCHEYRGRIEEAEKSLSSFLQQTDKSPLTENIQERQKMLREVVSLKSINVEQTYAAFVRAIDSRAYWIALDKAAALTELAPASSTFRWRYLVLADSLGETQATRKAAKALLQVETDLQLRKHAQLILDSVDTRRAYYEQSVTEADFEMSQLARSMFQQERLHLPTRLDRIRRPLQAALEIFPLGPEANLLQAMFLQHNSQAQIASRFWDIAASSGKNLAFYAKVIPSGRDQPHDILARVTLIEDSFRIEEIETDRRGKNLEFHARAIPWGDVSSIESDSYVLEIKSAGKRTVLLRPLDFNYGGFRYPGKGLLKQRAGASRRFSNSYLRLFERYPAKEALRYGSEHITFGEAALTGVIMGTLAVGTAGVGVAAGAATVVGATATTATFTAPLLVPGLIVMGGMAATAPIKQRLEAKYDVARNATLQQIIGDTPFLYFPTAAANMEFRTKY